MKKFKRKIYFILSIIFLIITIIFFIILFNRFNLPYNSQGYYFDPVSMVNYKEQSVFFFTLMTIFFFILTFIFIRKFLRKL